MTKRTSTEDEADRLSRILFYITGTGFVAFVLAVVIYVFKLR